jgi:Arm DNA-binding domain
MPLNDLTIKRAKPGPKIIKLSDGGGLQLWMTPDGAKRWRLAYRFAGKQRVLAVGVYPKVGLKDARERGRKRDAPCRKALILRGLNGRRRAQPKSRGRPCSAPSRPS